MRIDTPGQPHPSGVAADQDDETNALVSDLPQGLPFIGDEDPACAAPDAAVIFELAGTMHGAQRIIREAKRVCRGCPYIAGCAEWAISNNERWGVWGGMSIFERRREMRRA